MDNRNKASVLQWLMPTSIMMLAVIVMLLSFTHKANKEARTTVSKNLVSDIEAYGGNFLHELEKVGRAGASVAAVLADEGVKDAPRVAKLLQIAADSAGVEKALYCNMNGQALNLWAHTVDVSKEAYFGELSEAESPYIYVEAERSVIVMERVSSDVAQGYLLLFYPVERFSNTLYKSGYDPDSALVLVDIEGRILCRSGASDNRYVIDGNLLNTLESTDKAAAKSLRSRMNNGSRGNIDVEREKQKDVLIVAPLGTNHWDLVLCVTDDFIAKQMRYLRKNSSDMVTSLFVVIVIFFCIVVFVNIMGRFRSNTKKKELEDKADTDLLTGLNNKLATERKIKDFMLHNPDTQSMLFILDIDNFKKINDTMGHAFGDEVLRSLGKQIGGIFRASDIVGRVGGDEFMVFLKGIATEETILKEAKKVEDFFEGFQAGEYVKYKATASIGVAIFPQEGADFETLYKAADQGLYKAKKRGKNQLAFYRERDVDKTDEAGNEEGKSS